MATLGDMKARIADELARTDLTTQIARAINTAIAVYSSERFRFSDTIPSTPPTFNTVADRWIYTSADNAAIETVYKFDYIMALIGNFLTPLVYDTPASIRQFNQQGQMHGMPMWWSYEGNQLLIGPVPDQAYAITMGMFRDVGAPVADGDGGPWMNIAEDLIRSRAKYEIALHVTRNKDMQVAMSPYPPPPGQTGGHASYMAWKRLKGMTNRVTSGGRVRSPQF